MTTIHNIYNRLQKKILNHSFEAIKKCPKFNKSLHCSVLIAGKFIVCSGINISKFQSPWPDYRRNGIHAEYNCFKRFHKMGVVDDINKLELYNVRISRDGSIRDSRPCEKCQRMFFNPITSPRKIWFTNTEGVFQQWLP